MARQAQSTAAVATGRRVGKFAASHIEYDGFRIFAWTPVVRRVPGNPTPEASHDQELLSLAEMRRSSDSSGRSYTLEWGRNSPHKMNLLRISYQPLD